MKKVMILSRHAVPNYGSFLQAYALEKAVESLGYEACTLDYMNGREKSFRLCFAEIHNSRWNAGALHRAAFYCCNVPNRAIQFHRFERFRRNMLRLSREYGSLAELREDPPQADIYCTGSDQVWNETINGRLDWAYFLNFLPDDAARISYAASFGKDTVKEQNLKYMRECLSKYQAISVREDSGRKILDGMDLSGMRVLDPTLLIPGSEWRRLKGGAKVPAKGYVLLYQIHRDNALVNYAQNYAHRIGCLAVNVSVSYTQKQKGIKFIYLPSYQKLLALFDGAHCIVTDSFHATAFSILLNKPFVTMLPKLSTGRNRDILRLFGLESRILRDESDFDTPDQPIDYARVNTVLERERAQSMQWLKEALDRNCDGVLHSLS